MDFGLTESQRAIRELARAVLTPAAERARSDRRAVAAGLDRATWEALGRTGLLGVGVPEDLGGSGGGIVEACVLLEEVGRAGVPVPVLPTVLASLAAARFAPPDVRGRFLGAVAERHVAATVAPTPPALTARSEADGRRVDGTADHVPAAAHAAWMVVSASSPEGPEVLVVDLNEGGVELVPQPEPGGEPLSRVTLADAPAEPLARGEEPARWLEEQALVARCALQVGLAEAALRITAEYTSGREQFGRPLASFQAVQQRAADAYIDVETMRLTMWRAAWRLATDRPASEAVAAAAFFAAEAGQRVMASAQHLHGGIGVDVDYPLHRYVLWSKQVELAVGGANRNLARLGASLAAAAEEACR